MDRPTKTFRTPRGNQEVIYKSWLTGGEMEAIEEVLLTQGEISESGMADVTKLTGSAVNQLRHALVSAAVLSVDGVEQDCLELIRRMRKKDYDAVMTELFKVMTDDEIAPEKKTSDGA